jgi:hypothetical protein
MTKPMLCDQPVLRLNIPCYDVELLKSAIRTSGHSWLPHPFEIDETLSNPDKGIVYVYDVQQADPVIYDIDAWAAQRPITQCWIFNTTSAK